MSKNLMSLYAEVFDENGAVRNCGRFKTAQLIVLCEEMSVSYIDFGNRDTGMMHVENIQQFVSTLME